MRPEPTWGDMNAYLHDAIQRGFADQFDLWAVRTWPPIGSDVTPSEFFADEWPAWYPCAGTIGGSDGARLQ